MRKPKKFPLPNREEWDQKIKDDPSNSSLYVLEYYYNRMAIEEMNELREEVFNSNLTASEKKLYRSQSKYSHKKFHIMGGAITLSYPYLRGGAKPEKTIRLLEQQERRWKESIGNRYFSGESLRDLSREVTLEGNAYSAMSIDRIVQEQERRREGRVELVDLNKTDYVDLQLDATYDKVREEDTPASSYQNMPLFRLIGLEQSNLVWEFLYENVFPGETILTCQIALDELIDRNIGDVYLATADWHTSLRPAILTTLIGTEFQGCRFHLQKDITIKDRENEKLIEKLFRSVYDTTSNREEAQKRFSLFKTALKQFEKKVFPTWNRHFNDSIPFLDYPLNLAKQITTTNKLERSNEAIRRRTDAIYSNASKDSYRFLADSVTAISSAKWPDEPKGSVMTAQLTKIVHSSLCSPLYEEIDNVFEDDFFDRYRRTGLNWKNSVALRINVWVLPMKLNERVITGGLLLVHGIDKNKKEHLIHISQIRKHDFNEVEKALEEMLKRGLKTERIKLVVFNRPYQYLTKAVKAVLPNAEIFIEASYILERLLYQIPQRFKDRISQSLNSVYESSDLIKASLNLHLLKQELRVLDIQEPLQWLNKFDEKELLAVFKLLETGCWENYTPGDFAVHNSWKVRIRDLVNHPESVEETIKAFIRTLQKRKNKG